MLKKYSIRKPLKTVLLCLFLMAGLMVHAYGDSSKKAQKAHFSGTLAEASIEGMLRSLGFTVARYSYWEKHREDFEGTRRLVLKNAPYRSIYGHKARMEFLLLFAGRKILIQSKRLNVSGSADEKLPYVYLNALHNLPDYETMIIHSGTGWKKESLDWVREKARETAGFHVFSHDEFIDWAFKELK